MSMNLMGSPLALLGYLLALTGAPMVLLAARRAHIDTLSAAVRLCMWLVAGATVWIAASAYPKWRRLIGWAPSGAGSIGLALVTALCLVAAGAVVGTAQKFLGGKPTTENDQFLRVTSRSIGYRLFIVVTAGVTEEVLYRGFAVGIGSVLLGSRDIAAALSIFAFVLAHFRWGWGHLVPVFLAAAILTGAFVLKGDLFACMIAHALVDAIGIILAPALLAMKRRHKQMAGQDAGA